MNFNVDIPAVFIFSLIPLALIAVFVKPREHPGLLRVVIYILAFILILRPYVSISKKFFQLPKVGIFIDSSLSMSIENRFKDAKSVTRKVYLKLKKYSDVRIFKFGDTVKEIQLNDLDKLKPSYNLTDISKVIKEGVFDGSVIITDGRDTEKISPLSVSELSKRIVFTVGIGSSMKVPDAGIIDLKTPGIGFRNQKVKIQFTVVNSAGSKGKTFVYLKEGEVIVSRIEISIDGKEQIPVSMEFIPPKRGLKNYTIVVEKIPGEINLTNNRRNFQLQVNRRKIRILYVAGQPSWEYSYFRRLVKSDPQVELVSFLILRNPDNVTIVNEYELSLIHFPAREMFTEKIYEFDLLIYDNFSYRRFFPSSYLTHIKNFVMKGGGFIMLGGEDSFSRGGYVNTPIADILPVVMDSENSIWLIEEFNPVLTQSASHPILNVADDVKTSLEVWMDMPSIEGYDTGLKPKPDTTVLLKVRDNIPVLAVDNVGQGRVMAFNSNTTWRWCMGLAREGKTPYYYNRFWHKLIRYMIQSGDLKNIQVFPGKDRANVGEKISVNIKVLDQYWQPVDNARLSLEIKTSSGKRIPLPRVYPAGDDGWYHTTIPVTEVGAHKIKVRAYYQDKFLDEGEADFAGVVVNKEFFNTSLNKNLLKDISKISGGYYWDNKDVEPEKIISMLKKAIKDKNIIKKISWHHWLFYVLIILIITIEWSIRRRRGLA